MDMESKCWICESDSTYTEMDSANRRYYRCSNPECGEYDISRISRERKANDSQFKAQLMILANKCKDSDKIPLVVKNDNHEIEIIIINRSNI